MRELALAVARPALLSLQQASPHRPQQAFAFPLRKLPLRSGVTWLPAYLQQAAMASAVGSWECWGQRLLSLCLSFRVVVAWASLLSEKG